MGGIRGIWGRPVLALRMLAHPIANEEGGDDRCVLGDNPFTLRRVLLTFGQIGCTRLLAEQLIEFGIAVPGPVLRPVRDVVPPNLIGIANIGVHHLKINIEVALLSHAHGLGRLGEIQGDVNADLTHQIRRLAQNPLVQRDGAGDQSHLKAVFITGFLHQTLGLGHTIFSRAVPPLDFGHLLAR